MEQHPVPQHISSYKFRLVGDMTLKQFFQLAGGGLIALLFYASPLPNFLKWPFIVFFVLAGAALAFLPFEERPLEQWVVAFFRSIYSPTIFYWTKSDPKKKFFQAEVGDTTPTQQVQETVVSEVEGDGAIQQTHEHTASISRLEEAEKSFLSKLKKSVQQTTSPQQMIAGTTTTNTTNQETGGAVNVYQGASDQIVQRPEKKEVVLPESTPVEAKRIKEEENPENNTTSQQFRTEQVKQTLVGAQQTEAASAAQFSDQASPPDPPTTFNTIVGQVIDTRGGIVDGAILEIQDESGRPVRAIRSNKLGHFWIATPLENGNYRLTTEKTGFVFDPIQIEALGQIIPPIAVRAEEEIKEGEG